MIYRFTERELEVREEAIEALAQLLKDQHGCNLPFKILAEGIFETIHDGKIPHIEVVY